MPPDFKLEDYGAICLLRPLTPDARQWLDREAGPWQRADGAFAVELGECPDLLDLLMRDGWTVR